MIYPVIDNFTTPKHTKYLNLLSKLASDHKSPVRNNARLTACVVYKSDVVSFGYNEMKSHPFQAKYAKNPESIYLHAEVDAIKNALKYITEDELKRSTLYVCRVKYYDSSRRAMCFGLAKPCSGCRYCISTHEIKETVYSLDETGFAVL